MGQSLRSRDASFNRDKLALLFLAEELGIHDKVEALFNTLEDPLPKVFLTREKIENARDKTQLRVAPYCAQKLPAQLVLDRMSLTERKRLEEEYFEKLDSGDESAVNPLENQPSSFSFVPRYEWLAQNRANNVSQLIDSIAALLISDKNLNPIREIARAMREIAPSAHCPPDKDDDIKRFALLTFAGYLGIKEQVIAEADYFPDYVPKLLLNDDIIRAASMRAQDALEEYFHLKHGLQIGDNTRHELNGLLQTVADCAGMIMYKVRHNKLDYIHNPAEYLAKRYVDKNFNSALTKDQVAVSMANNQLAIKFFAKELGVLSEMTAYAAHMEREQRGKGMAI